MDNKINAIMFILENCDSVTVPISCFKTLRINQSLEHGDLISELDCWIQDSDKITTMFDTELVGLKRLNQYNDITNIKIIREIEDSSYYEVKWPDELNPYINTEENKYQISEFDTEGSIHIKIKELEDINHGIL